MREELDKAYRQTLYWVETDPPIALEIGKPNRAWARCQLAQGVRCSTFITAHNPDSQKLPEQTNLANHVALEQALMAAHWQYLPALAKHPSNDWPAEPGFVVWGMDAPEALRWAQRFQQNAVVVTDPTGKAHLHWFT